MTQPAPRRLAAEDDNRGGLLTQVAAATGLDPAYLEKDFWAFETLRAATVPRQIVDKDGEAHDLRFVFKGGTSLSRVFELTHRFSEDVDLLVVWPQAALSLNARDRALKGIVAAVQAHLGLHAASVVPSGSTTGVHRDTRFLYARTFTSQAITEGVLLEMGTRGGPDPSAVRQVRSLVADHAVATLGQSADLYAEFHHVSVGVLAPERTLLEKLSLLHTNAERYPASADKVLTLGRHFYDVHALLSDPGVRAALDALGPAGVASLAADVDARSVAAGWDFEARPAAGYGSGALVADEGFAEAAADAYSGAQDLLYAPVAERPSIEDCLGAIRAHAALL